jgi:ribulose-5-phosphate 4-epimerase/fuculose-1-phosphate aldolase
MIAQAESKFSGAEWRARCELAALFRVAALHEMSDLIYNHISLRVPGFDDRLLINPFGVLFKNITASG